MRDRSEGQPAQGRGAAVSSDEAAFFGDAAGLWPAYLDIREMILGLYPESEVRVHKTQISFRAPHPYVWVWRLKGKQGQASFFLTFSTGHGEELPHRTQAVFIRPGQWTRHLTVAPDGPAAGKLTQYVTTSFILRNGKGGAT